MRGSGESNCLEQMYPCPQNGICVGTEDGADLVQRFPGLSYGQVRLGDLLPFRDAKFDVVTSGRLLDVGCSCDYFMEVAAARGFVVEIPLGRLYTGGV